MLRQGSLLERAKNLGQASAYPSRGEEDIKSVAHDRAGMTVFLGHHVPRSRPDKKMQSFGGFGGGVMGWVWLGVVAIIVLIAFLLQRAKSRAPAGAVPSTDGHRLMTAKSGMTAAEMLRRVETLSKANAQWPEIWEQLNPDGDPAFQQLLVDFRGPYMFVPHAAINVLRIGCERALAVSPSADRVAAIRAAMKSDDQVVRPS